MLDTPCVLAPGALNNSGYVMQRFEGKMAGAHRIAWIKANGPIPEGLEIHHECEVRNCIEVTHLRLVTRRENLLLGDTIAARAAAATHCPHGHPYDATNTYISPRGYRDCRACGRARHHVLQKDARYREKKRQATRRWRERQPGGENDS